MKKKLLALAIAVAGLTVPLGFSSKSHNTVMAATTAEKSEMRSFVRNTMAQNHVRGSVVVIKDGQPQQISYGWAWYGKRIGNGNTKVVYPTCSLQKVLTGAMIVQLINETNGTDQQFSQYTKISRWYPNLRNANQISVGNLLTHTSGLTATGTEVNRGYNYSEDNAVKWVINNANATPEAKVGTYYYNNTNYILLAGIIKAVTGKSYEQNFQERIIDKLGLDHTYLYQNIPGSMTDAISYVWNGSKNYKQGAYVKRSLASQLVGAGNLFSTPMDYYKMQVGLTNGAILSSSDFHYLTHLKAKITDYSGGVYLKNNETLKMAYGNLAGTHFGDWFQMTTDNQNGLVMFLNQTAGNESANKAVGYQILNHIKANTFTAN
ncbi:serine hydrolase domain-containing protein [Lactobacillus hamsteri]|uniref:Beta-lactamase n=2 Tax=Lactobacillus hamsteri TaxID=96565 RepID=A0A0R1YMF2_9LACO|nr:beta-lactamase [Lactobacillus hamsteri DSM 5661 = JCM 6256]